jgi:hypothetical protein
MGELIGRLYEEIFHGKSDLISIPTILLEPDVRVPLPGDERGPSPLSEALGHRRILRTSPLTEVPFVCCTDC